MRGRRIISVAVLLSIVLIGSGVLASGIVDVSKIPVLNSAISGVQPMSPGNPKVAVDPWRVIKDYVYDSGYQINDKFILKINVSEVLDLFTWQVNVTWNPGVLNFSKVKVYGPFLRGTSSPHGTSGWIDRDPTKNVTFLVVDYDKGFASIAETILDSRPGAAGVYGNGDLVEIEFKILTYGNSTLVITKTGILPTSLLDSTGAAIGPLDTSNGYFKNKLTGDASGDTYINTVDVGLLNLHWSPAAGAPPWSLGYDRDVDINDDKYINTVDVGLVNLNWGRWCPSPPRP